MYFAGCGKLNTIKYGSTDISGWEVDDLATFSCKNGYSYVGENPRRCQDNGHWSGDDGRCKGKNL